MEKGFSAANAFQQSLEDKKRNEELSRKYQYRTWVPESIIPVGDAYVYYDDYNELQGVGFSSLYIFIREHFNNASYTQMTEKTYTYTEEGKDVLNILENVTSVYTMEVYKCCNCEELYGSTKELAKYNGKNTCGICQDNLKREDCDAYGIEHLDEEEE